MNAPATAHEAVDRAVRRAHPLAEVDRSDRIVVLRLDDPDGTPHVLRDTAASIWDEIDGERTPEDICAALAESYATPMSVLRADVLAYLEMLRDAGLIEAADLSV